jgi:type II secretory pathway pseudopilin PulG
MVRGPMLGGQRDGPGLPLLEPLIVITVILILASIILPQLGVARERAHKTSCVTNQRNIETAIAMWSTDNPNMLYVGGTVDVSTPNFGDLTGSMRYTGLATFREPDDPAPGNANGIDYYLSMGGPTGGSANEAAVTYGHVACAYDRQPDPWVAGYDGTLGKITGINHGRGASASP